VILADPKGYLRIQAPGQAALLTHVGQAILSLVLDQPDGGLDRVFGREGIDAVLKAAATGRRHPIGGRWTRCPTVPCGCSAFTG
jgi:hypothetical protein